MEQSRAFTDIKKLFYTGIAWNSFEVVVYQLLLHLHLVVLYMRSNATLFGLFGLLLASIYVQLPIINAGLDQALSLYAYQLKSSRASFVTLFVRQLFNQTIIWLLVTIVIVLLYSIHLVPAALTQLPTSSLLLIVVIVLLETQRRSCRHLLQLFFDNRFTALTEISALLLYITLFWSMAYKNGFSVNTLLLPLLAQSIWSLTLLSYRLTNTYRSMPDTTPSALSTQELWRKRLTLSGSVMSRFLFSTNAFMYVIGALFGVTSVAILKLANSVGTLMTIVIEHTIGIPVLAFIAHVKAQQSIDSDDAHRLAFTWLSSIIASALLFVLINYQKIVLVCSGSLQWWHLIIIYILLMLLENIIIITEKVAYLAGLMHKLIAHNALASCLWLSTLIIASTGILSLLQLLLFAVGIRSVTLVWHVYTVHSSPFGKDLLYPNLKLTLSSVLLLTLALYTLPYVAAPLLCK